jgi:hypothetical protein
MRSVNIVARTVARAIKVTLEIAANAQRTIAIHERSIGQSISYA